MESFPTAERPRQRLLVFARLPESGRVKSRLARSLGDEATLTLYAAMVRDLLDSIGHSSSVTEIEVGWTGGDDTSGALVRDCFAPHSLFMQTGSTLGDRLVIAFSERIFFHAATKVIAIGTDDPALSRETIDTAFALLDSCEWVIGPADDGGYYLIGARGASFRTAVFHDVQWGQASVFDETMTTIRGLGATVAVLSRRRDIDRLEDLEAFLRDPELTPHVAAAARALELR